MKSYNHLYERFISDENYYLAVRNATKHKGGKKRKWRYARYIRDNAEELKPRFIEYASNFKNAHHKPKTFRLHGFQVLSQQNDLTKNHSVKSEKKGSKNEEERGEYPFSETDVVVSRLDR